MMAATAAMAPGGYPMMEPQSMTGAHPVPPMYTRTGHPAFTMMPQHGAPHTAMVGYGYR